MPPKRRAPTHPLKQRQQQGQKQPRQSALAKENNISPATESEIKEAFSLFSDTSSKPPSLPSSQLPQALTALGVAPASKSELQDLLEAVDPDDEGYIEYKNFVAIAALKLNSRSEESRREEVDEAFDLFTKYEGGGGEKITLAGLKKIAEVLKEDVSAQVLNDMVLEANGGAGVLEGVDRDDFEAVMRRAGVFK